MADHDRSRSPPRMLKQEDEPDRGTDQDVKYEQDESLPEKDIMETGNQRDTEETMSISSSRASTASGHSSNADLPRTSNSKQRPVTLARTASILPDAIVVPRSQRRGLLARFALIPEVENPEHYARQTKWFLTFIVAFCAMAAPMGSAIVMPVLQEISTAFNATETVTNMSVAVYMLSMSIFPLWWSSFSERLGRRTIYISSFILFVVFAILSAISKSIAMLIVFRVLSGGAAASVQAVGAGTIADIWETKERGRAMGIFYLGSVITMYKSHVKHKLTLWMHIQTSLRPTLRSHHWWCFRLRSRLAINTMVPGHLWRHDTHLHHLRTPGNPAQKREAIC